MVIDLRQIYDVTGVNIFNEKWYHEDPGTFELQVLADNVNWTTVDTRENSFKHWEVTVARFNAGIQLPGADSRFIKIILNAKNKNALHLKRVQVYGKEQK